MNVLFIASWYPSTANPLKGVFVKKHVHAVKAAGINVEVLALVVNYSKKIYDRKSYISVDEAGVKTHIIEVNSRFYKFLYLDLFWQFGLLKKYYYEKVKGSFQPEIIHSNVLFPAAILAHRLSKKEDIPHVITEHWSKVPKFMKKSLWASLGKKAYNYAAGITTVSEFLKGRIAPFIKDDSKIKIVPNVINFREFSYKKKRPAGPSVAFTCVAHWTSPKRPDLIFNALERVSKKSNRKIHLNVVGEGPLLNVLKNENWSFQINYRGNMPGDQLAILLQDSDYFLHGSDIETFSVVIAEALSTGTPVLASNAGAIPELIHSGNGITCNNEVDDWEKGIEHLITKTDWDHEKIARETSRFSYAEIGQKFKAIYKEVLKLT